MQNELKFVENSNQDFDDSANKTKPLVEAHRKLTLDLIRNLHLAQIFAAPLGLRIGVKLRQRWQKKIRNRGIEVFPGIAEKLPFLLQQFDYALMVTTICFIDDIEQSFKEAWRVLKPNGIIIIGFVDSESKIAQTYLKRKHESIFYQDATFYSTKEVLEHLQNAGFKESSTIQTLFPEPNLDAIKSGFGEGSFVVITSHK